MTTNCDDVHALLPGYLDGELTEAQAAPLRSHLLACPTCREAVQEGRVLQRWFAAGREEPVQVPQGFAARLARRAFAGDPGWVQPQPTTPNAHADGPRRPSLLPFVLSLTTVAAALLFVLSLALQRRSLPEGSGSVEATQDTPPWLEKVETPLERLPVGPLPRPAAPAEPEADADARERGEPERDRR